MTQDAVANPWAAKARALDRYRWLLLRERHGLAGSALRFAREALSDWWFGVRANSRLAEAGPVEPCDFLLLQSSPKVIKLQRKKLLIEALRARGHRLIETALREPRVLLRERQLSRPPFRVPTRYFGIAAHAQWLVEHYQPRVLLNDRNGSLYSPFLRLALNARQSVLVHLAHATTGEGSRRLGMNDYDYYFLFGQSSLDALQARELRFGTSTAVLAGSHMIDKAFDLPPADPARRVMLVLGVGPDKEKEAGYQRTYALLRDWAARNPDYQILIKAHPRSQVPFWQEAAGVLDNVSVLPRESSLAQALEQASVVINIMSNAVIEAGLAARPVISVNLSEDADIFGQRTFFGDVLRGVDELSRRLDALEKDYASAVVQSRDFGHFHLAHGSSGLEINLQILEQLLRREGLPVQVESRALLATV
ncbi:capsule biosynthesis protein [Pseudomonas sp. PDM15]|uniref:capsule biosynthesis protein n=1 Tax=Pseudomonas sp. PDM15 TaxID=2769303 RepID=UPI00177E9CC3|nr:capsule biosynthesis protein [Pseudomonas sp. PDM15]MBD9427378.1 capsule biosynthesis protein [Pseudomonas sp. PDM15]